MGDNLNVFEIPPRCLSSGLNHRGVFRQVEKINIPLLLTFEILISRKLATFRSYIHEIAAGCRFNLLAKLSQLSIGGFGGCMRFGTYSGKEGWSLGDHHFMSIIIVRAVPVLEEFKAWLDKKKDQTPPKGLLGKAIGYTLSVWSRLTRYLEDGHITPDNNAAGGPESFPGAIAQEDWHGRHSREVGPRFECLPERVWKSQPNPSHMVVDHGIRVRGGGSGR